MGNTKLHAFSAAVEFASRYKSINNEWCSCDRPDWLLWYAGRRLTGEAHHRMFVRIAVDCARLVLPLFESARLGDRRVRDCLDVTQRWIDGTATFVDVAAASVAAYEASCDAASVSASYAAYAASDAADAADTPEAYVAAASASSSLIYVFRAARVESAESACGINSKCCKIIRQHIPVCQ